MTRPLRIQYPNAYYHVTCRGNAREDVFRDEVDRKTFLALLVRSIKTFEVEILAYVLMNNHFHLLLKTPRGNLSEFMRHFNISYTSFFNRRHRRVGHLYQGRYKAFLIEADSYLLEVSRYLHLNPVRIQRQKDTPAEEKLSLLKDYAWSSFPGYIRPNDRKPFVNYREVLSYPGGDTLSGRKRYTTFVAEGLKKEVASPFVSAKGHGIVGGTSFVERMRKTFLSLDVSHREQPQLRRLKISLSPEELIENLLRITGKSRKEVVSKRARGPERVMVMEMLYRHCGISQPEIGRIMGGVDYSAVSLARRRLRDRMEGDKGLVLIFQELENALSRIKSNK